jgi:hypothetical protein
VTHESIPPETRQTAILGFGFWILDSFILKNFLASFAPLREKISVSRRGAKLAKKI